MLSVHNISSIVKKEEGQRENKRKRQKRHRENSDSVLVVTPMSLVPLEDS